MLLAECLQVESEVARECDLSGGKINIMPVLLVQLLTVSVHVYPTKERTFLYLLLS